MGTIWETSHDFLELSAVTSMNHQTVMIKLTYSSIAYIDVQPLLKRKGYTIKGGSQEGYIVTVDYWKTLNNTTSCTVYIPIRHFPEHVFAMSLQCISLNTYLRTISRFLAVTHFLSLCQVSILLYRDSCIKYKHEAFTVYHIVQQCCILKITEYKLLCRCMYFTYLQY